jgi:hypothetical protein
MTALIVASTIFPACMLTLILMLGHLQPAIPRQRASQGSGEFDYMLTQCGNGFVGLFHGNGRAVPLEIS